MRKLANAAFLLLLLPLVAPFPAAAQYGDLPLGKWWKFPRVVEQLKLSPDQIGRLDEIFSKNRRDFIDLKADVDRRQVDVEELLARKDSDPKKVGVAVEAMEQARSRLRKAHTMMIVEMKGVLTADQWQTLVDRAEEMRRLREERGRRFESRLEGRPEGRRGAMRDRGQGRGGDLQAPSRPADPNE